MTIVRDAHLQSTITEKGFKMTDEISVEEWLAIRKEAGLKI
jgi:hypothetical protein